MNSRLNRSAYLRLAAISISVFLGGSRASTAGDAFTPFAGEKTSWHDGFDRFDFVMDEEALAIGPFKAPAGEGVGGKDPGKGPPPLRRDRPPPSRGRQSLVVAGLLLGPSTSN